MTQHSNQTQEGAQKPFSVETHDMLSRYELNYPKFKLLYSVLAIVDDHSNVITTLHNLGSVVHTLEDTFLLSGVCLAVKTRYAVDWVAIIEEAKEKRIRPSIVGSDIFPVDLFVSTIVSYLRVKNKTETRVNKAVNKKEGKCNGGPVNRGLYKRRTKKHG